MTPKGRILRLASLVVSQLLVGAGATRVAGQEQPYVDWPLGVIRAAPGATLVMGHNVHAQQNFRSTTNRDYPNQEHTGLDLQVDQEGRRTIGADVLAVTDGVVECIDRTQWGAQGDVVVVKHRDELYSVYGHLNAGLKVRKGQSVRRGQKIGTVQRWPVNRDNTHLHFEIREFVYWSHTSHEPVLNPEERPGEAISCAGPGYLREGLRLSDQTWTRTWKDPVDFYYSHRPPYPRAIVVNDFIMHLGPKGDTRGSVAVYPSADLAAEPSGHLDGSSVVTALGIETAQDSTGLTQRFYKLVDEEPTERYILGFYSVGHGSDLRVGEPLTPWKPASSRPLVDFSFRWQDFRAGKVKNRGSRPGDGILVGELTPVFRDESPDPDPTDYAAQLDGETAYIEVDRSGDLPGGSVLEAEAQIWRAANDDEDAIVSKWGEDQWLLTLYPDGNGRLAFAVHLADGDYSNVEYLLPDRSYLGKWAQVAVRYSPEQGQMLFWNGQLVAQKLASDLEAEGHTDRAIAPGGQPIHVGDANNSWSRFGGRIDAVRIWLRRR